MSEWLFNIMPKTERFYMEVLVPKLAEMRALEVAAGRGTAAAAEAQTCGLEVVSLVEGETPSRPPFLFIVVQPRDQLPINI